MTSQRLASVWDAIGDTPEQAENRKLWAMHMTAMKDRIAQNGISQAQAAELFGVTQPRVSDLVRGKDQALRPGCFGEHGNCCQPACRYSRS